MFRLIFLAFYGSERFPEHARHHLRESPPSMTMPLIALGALSIVGGFVGVPAWMHLGPNQFERFLEPSLEFARTVQHAEPAPGGELTFALISVAVALAGIYLAYRLYVVNPRASGDLARRMRAPYSLLLHKYYVDEVYDAAIVKPVVAGSREFLWRGIDVDVIDGSVNGAARMVQNAGSLLKNIQNGLVRSYATWILAGAVLILLYITLSR
jgi:NADH-quinone oxidoreductase subunit L